MKKIISKQEQIDIIKKSMSKYQIKCDTCGEIYDKQIYDECPNCSEIDLECDFEYEYEDISEDDVYLEPEDIIEKYKKDYYN